MARTRREVWGGRGLPKKSANGHYCVVGCTQSGKTVTIRHLMQSVLPAIVKGSNQRALVYDPKGEMYRILHGMDLACEIKTLYPSDARCYAWDIAADVIDPNSVKTVAEVLVPEEEDTQKYFPRAARQLLEGLLQVFVDKGKGEWTLEDVLVVMRNAKILQAIFERSGAQRYLVDTYFRPAKTFESTMSTLDTFIGRYQTIAACWAHTDKEKRTSLRDWAPRRDRDGLGESSILLVRRDPEAESALDPMNRVLFQRLIQLLLSGPEVRECEKGKAPKTWVFFDEASKAGNIKGLDDLLLQGHSKGVRVVLGFQDISAMWKEYGKDAANALVGQCEIKAILQLRSPETAEWASKLVGRYRGKERRKTTSKSRSDGPGGTSFQVGKSYTMDRVERDAVLYSEFYRLSRNSPEGHMEGYYQIPHVGTARLEYDFTVGLKKAAKATKVPEVVSRPRSHQYLRPRLTSQDLERLGLAGLDIDVTERRNERDSTREEERKERKGSLLGQVKRLDFDGWG